MSLTYTQDSDAARERAAAMLALLQRGDTLETVADVYQVSRERVRQLVRKHFPGVDWRRPGRPPRQEGGS